MPWMRLKAFRDTDNAEWRAGNWYRGKNREANKDAQKLANLVKTKEQVIEDLKKSLVRAKPHILAMQEEIRSLQASDAAEADHPSC